MGDTLLIQEVFIYFYDAEVYSKQKEYSWYIDQILLENEPKALKGIVKKRHLKVNA